jgi:acyl-CoA synthetase (NDP forming)
VDTGNQNRFQMDQIVDILARDPNIDNLALLSLARVLDMDGRLDNLVEMIGNLKEQTTKPIISIVTYCSLEEIATVAEAVDKFQKRGIPTFTTIDRGARALKNTYEYYRMRDLISSEKNLIINQRFLIQENNEP